ncbi:ABC transporter substrate-binding protein [Inquilinus sp. KBS0705]|nr:ABC transporter substrate-binding protein [Inquilinus sp. KBS0705]
MPQFYDQLNRVVNIPHQPKRIISIVPSQTELLFYLELDEQVTGVTNFCIHPTTGVANKAKIGGTKQLNMNAIHQLNPDLIIANKEENEQRQVEELMQHYPVWISDINDLPTALDMITKVGDITSTKEKADKLVTQISAEFELLKPAEPKLNVAYLIWRKPYMAAGSDTFINSMLQLCGLKNAVTANRYPQVTLQQLADAHLDVLLLSSEPYPFAQKHVDELQSLLPQTKIILVDGELFSWYGSRLLQAPAYFNALISKLKAM